MTILHVSDLHFEKRWYHWLLDQAPPHDLLVISGDLLDLGAPTSPQRQIAWVLGWLNAQRGPVCVCSGNHDLEWHDATEHWAPAYWLRHRVNPHVWGDGQRVTFDGLSVLNIGCTTRPKGGAADVWVVHAPPTGTLVSARDIGFEGGDPELVAAVRRHSPRLVLAGHVHAPLRWHDEAGPTVYMNPGCDRAAAVPNHILINSRTLEAQRFTARGSHARVALTESTPGDFESPLPALTPAA